MPREKNIGLVSSVPFESKMLLDSVDSITVISPDVTAAYVGSIPFVHVTSGIGIANAAHATTVLIEQYSPRIIVLMGIGGAYPGSGLEVEDIALAQKEIYADLGVPKNDVYHSIKEIGIPLVKKGRKTYYNEFPLEKGLLTLTRKVLSKHDLKVGAFLTVSRITVTRKRAHLLGKTYNAICENMEGAAVAHICTRYGIPMIEMRGISNIVGNRNTENWKKESAAEKCQKAVLKLLHVL